MRPAEVRRYLLNVAKITRKAQRLSILSTKRKLAVSIKRAIKTKIPKLSRGLNKVVVTKTAVKEVGDSLSTLIKMDRNQPNARRFLTNQKGTWRKGPTARRANPRLLTPGGGLFLNKPGGGTTFIKGAFVKKLDSRDTGLVFKRIKGTDKITPIRGYSSSGIMKRLNKTSPGFLQQEFTIKGVTMLRAEYFRIRAQLMSANR